MTGAGHLACGRTALRAWALGRKVLRASALALVVTVLAGCGSLPRSGPVLQGPALAEDRLVAGGSVLAQGPSPLQEPDDLVEGFLAAVAGYATEYAVARSYLTDQRRAAWRPDRGVVIYPSRASLRVTTVSTTPAGVAEPAGRPVGAVPQQRPATARVRVEAPVEATIDHSGQYRPSRPGATRTMSVTLTQVPGVGWRVAEVPDGLWLSRDDFRFTYSAFPLYYPDRSGDYLVPDVRWFPDEVSAATATSVVQALLAGPARWLRPALHLPAPGGTHLATPAVLIDDGVATVDLSEQALAAQSRDRTMLVAQLTTTLRRVNSAIKSVRVTVDREALSDQPEVVGEGAVAPDGVGSAPSAEVPYLRLDPSGDVHPLFLDRQGKVLRLDDDGNARPPSDLPAFGAGARELAAAIDLSAFAVLNQKRTKVLYRPAGDVDGPDVLLRAPAGSRLAGPAFDPFGWVWSARVDNRGFLQAVRPGGVRPALSAPKLRGLTVHSLRLSRDGSRALVSASGRGGAHLFVLAVSRTETGVPVLLGEAVDLMPGLRSVGQAVWADEDTVVAIATDADGIEGPWRLRVGGALPDPEPSIAGARSLAAVEGLQENSTTVYVGTSDSRILQLQGRGWVEVVIGGTWPAVAG